MPTKREFLLDLMQRAWPYVHLDGRAAGVDLPEWLRGPTVPIQIGYNMPLAIPDLTIDDFGITATLSFRRTPHTCRIPWAAIYAISDGEKEGMVFAESLPEELREPLAKAMMESLGEGEEAAPPPDIRPAIAPAAAPAPAAAVDYDAADPVPADEPAPVPRMKSGKPRPSHLKLV